MRRAADLYPGEAKTDRRDAYVIADTARTRCWQVHWLDTGSDALLEQLRVLNGFDIDLAADLTRLTNRLRDALTSISPALERAIGSRLAHGGVQDLMAKYPTPTALRAAGRSRITKTIKARSPRLAAKVTDAVLAALDAQTVTLPADGAVGRVIAEVAAELDRLQRRRDALASEIEEVFLAHPFGELLMSLPGIGPRTGARILAEIGRGQRVRHRLQTGQLRRARPRHPPVRHLAQRRVQESTREPPAQERHVPCRVRLAARPRVEDLLRPQTRRRQPTQRCAHLPGAAPLRRHPRHAP
jgi:transposase